MLHTKSSDVSLLETLTYIHRSMKVDLVLSHMSNKSFQGYSQSDLLVINPDCFLSTEGTITRSRNSEQYI